MSEGWILLRLSRDLEIAVEQARVHRILERHSPDYAAHASVARSLYRGLGLDLDRSQPGVIAVMRDGSCWHAGDATLADSRTPLTFVPVPGDLLATSPPWCRGLLVGQDRHAFVADPTSLEAACG